MDTELTRGGGTVLGWAAAALSLAYAAYVLVASLAVPSLLYPFSPEVFEHPAAPMTDDPLVSLPAAAR